MGKIKQGVLGGFSGKVGNVVGGSWKGIAYMRIKPSSVANPKTDLQLDQRAKFALLMRFLQPLTQFLKVGFKNYAVKMTPFNCAMSYNFRNAIIGDYPDCMLDYPNAMVAKGTLATARNQHAASTAAGSITFSWDDNSDEGNASPLDKTLIVAFNEVKGEAIFQVQPSDRSATTKTITVPGSFSTDTVHCYIAFITVDGKLLSNSKYAGAVTVL